MGLNLFVGGIALRNNTMDTICIVIVMSIILHGCGMQTEEDALDSAIKSAERTFYSNEEVKTNEQTTTFDFYLPSSLSIEEESENNVILSDGNQHYIIFYNDLESPKSKINYKSAKDSDSLAYESFEDEERFGYLQVIAGTDENYQIQAGIGGVKITTYTSKKDMAGKAEELMKIARSIVGQNMAS